MADKSSIQWTEATWNPIRGCSRVSEGCRNCYAERVAARFSGPGQAYEGLAEMTPSGPRWTGTVRLVEEHLEDPFRWKRPRRIFVNSMSDLFHESLSDEDIDQVFAVMALCPQHIFQVLTKRAERMYRYLAGPYFPESRVHARLIAHGPPELLHDLDPSFPLKNVHLGVSVEDQKTADERIPWLLKTPAAVRWVSYEPALGPVRFGPLMTRVSDLPNMPRRTNLKWIVVGGESGPGARPFDIQWSRDTIAQCRAAGVPVFVKQLGRWPYEGVLTALELVSGEKGRPRPTGQPLTEEAAKKILDDSGVKETFPKYLKLRDGKGGDISEWPEDLKVREYPRV
jgi:protein gp37